MRYSVMVVRAPKFGLKFFPAGSGLGSACPKKKKCNLCNTCGLESGDSRGNRPSEQKSKGLYDILYGKSLRHKRGDVEYVLNVESASSLIMKRHVLGIP